MLLKKTLISITLLIVAVVDCIPVTVASQEAPPQLHTNNINGSTLHKRSLATGLVQLSKPAIKYAVGYGIKGARYVPKFFATRFRGGAGSAGNLGRESLMRVSSRSGAAMKDPKLALEPLTKSRIQLPWMKKTGAVATGVGVTAVGAEAADDVVQGTGIGDMIAEQLEDHLTEHAVERFAEKASRRKTEETADEETEYDESDSNAAEDEQQEYQQEESDEQEEQEEEQEEQEEEQEEEEPEQEAEEESGDDFENEETDDQPKNSSQRSRRN